MSIWFMRKGSKFLSKVISILIVQSFILSNIVFAIPQTSTADLSKAKEVVVNPDKVVIPRESGMVKSKFVGTSGKLIIHIQDAHCNYEAQSNIAKILENLIKNDGLSLVSVEGADGIIDTAWFKAFPDEEVRKEVADYFMRKGEITGPEFLSITTDYPIKLFGAETRSYYIQNLNAFTTSYPLKDETEKYYNQIKSALNRLKGFIYNDELKTLDAKMADYESKKIQFNEYVRFLQGMAEKHKINLRDYDNFFKLISALVYEKKIDFNVTDKERSTLIDELSKKLPKDVLTELVSQSIAFKVGKISSVEYYAYLKSLAGKNDIDITTRFPNLANYIIYNLVYAKVENEKLFTDIKHIETAIKEKLFQNDDQRTIEKLARHIDTLLGLINIKLLNGDFEYYKTHKDEFAPDVFAEFIKKKTIQYGLAYDIDTPSDAVAKSTKDLEDFYAIAIKRDTALVDNTLNAMMKENQQIAVLVTGGFHSEGISKLLEKKDVSYIVVCPTITKDVPSPYIQILTNQRTPLEDILVGTAHAKENMVCPWRIAQIISMSEKVLALVVEGVSPVDGRTLADRVKYFKADWPRMYAEDVVGNLREHGVKAVDLEKWQSETIAAIDAAFRAHDLPNADREAVLSIVRSEFPLLADEFAAEIARRQARKGARTSGTSAVGPYNGLSLEEAKTLDGLIRESFAEDTYEREVVKLPDERVFNFIVHFGLKERIDSHNAEVDKTGQGVKVPFGLYIHPGRGGDLMGHTLLQGHIDSFEFENLTPEERVIVMRHELAHLEIFNDPNGQLASQLKEYLRENSNSNEEDFVDSLPGCDTRNSGIRNKLKRLEETRRNGMAAAIGNFEAMKAFLMADIEYGDTARNRIEELAKEKRQKDLEKFVRETFVQRYNINLQKTALTRRPYSGYNRIIILSSTDSAARFKEAELKIALAGVKKDTEIYSLASEGFDEAGQVLGILSNLEILNERTKGRFEREIEEGSVNAAIFPDAGMAERFDPMTPALGDQRGWQDLLGVFTDSNGSMVKSKLVSGVILNSMDFAATNKGRPFIDIFWTSQQIAGTIPHDKIERKGFSYQKFLVPIDWNVPQDVLIRQLWQFGTAAVGKDGEILAFFGNQKSGAVRQTTEGKLELDPAKKHILETLKSAPGGAGFDFGSLSMSNAMLVALWHYWREKTDIVDGIEVRILEHGIKTGKIEAKWKRDIDPDFTQPLTFLLQAIVQNPDVLKELPDAAVLRKNSGEEKRTALRNAVSHIRDALPDDIRRKMKEVVKDEKKGQEKKIVQDSVTETIEFFLLNRDNKKIFGDLTKVVGTIMLGENAEWQTYRSALDAANDKLFALTGLRMNPADNKVVQIKAVSTDDSRQPENAYSERPADIFDNIRAENMRRRGDIKNSRICDFYIGNEHIVLSREKVTEDKPWVFTLPDGQKIIIHNSIVQNCVLYPGSEITNSVVEDSQGVIGARNSYIQRSTVKEVKAIGSMIHMIVDSGSVEAIGKITTDVFRPEIKGDKLDDRFPQGGQTRITVPTKYDPKTEDGNVVGSNKFAVGKMRKDTKEIGIRGMKCVLSENAEIENEARLRALILGKMPEALEKYLASLDVSGQLNSNLIRRVITNIYQSNPAPAIKSALMAFYDIVAKNHPAAFLKFGTSGLRDKDENLIDMEVYINTKGFIEYLIAEGGAKGGINKGDTVVIAGDFRPSTSRILKAAIAAILDSGCEVDYQGNIPTPAVTYYAMQKKRASIMVTGSHIPYGMNGIKFNRANGEILKSEEKPILEHVKNIRKEKFLEQWNGSLFDRFGWFSPKSRAQKDIFRRAEGALNFAGREAENEYVLRYKKVFGDTLKGREMVVYQQSAVGRDILVRIFKELGAKVYPVYRMNVRKAFLAVDTEKMTAVLKNRLRALARRHERIYGHKPFAVITADGDSDRPVFCDENGEFLPGDKLGVLASLYLKPNFVALPITCNSDAVTKLRQLGAEVKQTQVGSPYINKAIIDEIKAATVDNRTLNAVGYEANGGYLIGTEWKINGETLAPLPTRDAALPILCALKLAVDKNQKVSELFNIFNRHTDAGAIDNKTPGCEKYTAKMGNAIKEALSPSEKKNTPEDKNTVEVNFITAKIIYRDGTEEDLWRENGVEEYFDKVKRRLGKYLTPERGFGRMAKINYIDGIRIFFENGDIIHFRPSGNAPEFRIYAESETQKRATEIVAMKDKILSELITDFASGVFNKKDATSKAINGRLETPGKGAVRSETANEASKEVLTLEDRIAAQIQTRAALESQDLTVLGVNLATGELVLPAGVANYKYRGDQNTEGLMARKIIAKDAVVSQERFDANKARKVYVMNHGYVPIPQELYNYLFNEMRKLYYPGSAELSVGERLALDEKVLEAARIHDTFFPQVSPLIPGSIQYQMTGAHYQGDNFDIKYVTEGRGIQYLVKFDKQNQIVDVIAQYLEPGTWAYALPGYMDIVINLGGLRFTDMAGAKLSANELKRLDIETEAELYARLSKETGLEIKNNSDLPKAESVIPALGLAHIFYMYNGQPYVAMNPAYKGQTIFIRWAAAHRPSMILQGMSLLDAYRSEPQAIITGMLQEDFTRSVFSLIEEGATLGALGASAEVKLRLRTLATVQTPEIFQRDKEQAAKAFTKMEALYRSGKPVTFVPNIMTDREKYVWGMPERSSNILTTAKNWAKANLAITPNSRVSERWLVSTDLNNPSVLNLGEGYQVTRGGGAVTISVKQEEAYTVPVQVYLGNYPDVFGKDHLKEMGPKITATAKLLDAAQWLSAQIHHLSGLNAKPEFWVPLSATNEALIGFANEVGEEELLLRIEAIKEATATLFPEGLGNLPPETIRAGLNQSPAIQRLTADLNRMQMKEGEVYAVEGGQLHALLQGFIFEGSYNPQNMGEATKRFADWYGRPSQTEQSVKMAEEAGAVRQDESGRSVMKKSEASEFTPKPIMLSEKEGVGRSELIWARPGGVFERFNVETTGKEAMPVSEVLVGRAYSLYVKEGQIEIVNEHDKVVQTLGEGEEYLVGANVGRHSFRGKGLAYVWYSPLQGERIMYAAFQGLQREQARLASEKAQSQAIPRTPFKIWAPYALYKGTDASGERKFVNAVTSELSTLEQYTSLDELMSRGFNPATDVLVATDADINKAGRNIDTMKNILSARLLVLPKVNVDRMGSRTLAYVREVEEAGIILGDTTQEDIASKSDRAQDFARIMTQMTGKIVTIEDLKLLLASDATVSVENVLERLRRILEQLLLTVPPERYEIDNGLAGRRETLSSV